MSVHKQTKNIINRLFRIEGHTKAVKRMVEENQSCADILIQIAAIRSAIDKVGRIILEDHSQLPRLIFNQLGLANVVIAT